MEELTAWADEKILGLEEPPCFVIDLALDEIPVSHQELDLIRNEASEVEISRLARLYCYRLALISRGRASELLHWASDGIRLCNEGIKSFSDSEPLIKVAIREVAEIAPN